MPPLVESVSTSIKIDETHEGGKVGGLVIYKCLVNSTRFFTQSVTSKSLRVGEAPTYSL